MIQQFLEQQYQTNPNSWIASQDLYAKYERFCQKTGMECVSKNQFGREMRQNGYEKGRKANQRVWIGIESVPNASESRQEAGKNASESVFRRISNEENQQALVSVSSKSSGSSVEDYTKFFLHSRRFQGTIMVFRQENDKRWIGCGELQGPISSHYELLYRLEKPGWYRFQFIDDTDLEIRHDKAKLEKQNQHNAQFQSELLQMKEELSVQKQLFPVFAQKVNERIESGFSVNHSLASLLFNGKSPKSGPN